MLLKPLLFVLFIGLFLEVSGQNCKIDNAVSVAKEDIRLSFTKIDSLGIMPWLPSPYGKFTLAKKSKGLVALFERYSNIRRDSSMLVIEAENDTLAIEYWDKKYKKIPLEIEGTYKEFYLLHTTSTTNEKERFLLDLEQFKIYQVATTPEIVYPYFAYTLEQSASGTSMHVVDLTHSQEFVLNFGNLTVLKAFAKSEKLEVEIKQFCNENAFFEIGFSYPQP
ncbi:MAG TPA: hypothetical protein DDX98_02425 [Bacteroidales bacterium]|jgi:hypothetical protein|nr:hypothetical protein [Bacteroidales bacterium]